MSLHLGLQVIGKTNKVKIYLVFLDLKLQIMIVLIK